MASNEGRSRRTTRLTQWPAHHDEKRRTDVAKLRSAWEPRRTAHLILLCPSDFTLDLSDSGEGRHLQIHASRPPTTTGKPTSTPVAVRRLARRYGHWGISWSPQGHEQHPSVAERTGRLEELRANMFSRGREDCCSDNSSAGTFSFLFPPPAPLNLEPHLERVSREALAPSDVPQLAGSLRPCAERKSKSLLKPAGQLSCPRPLRLRYRSCTPLVRPTHTPPAVVRALARGSH